MIYFLFNLHYRGNVFSLGHKIGFSVIHFQKAIKMKYMCCWILFCTVLSLWRSFRFLPVAEIETLSEDPDVLLETNQVELVKDGNDGSSSRGQLDLKWLKHVHSLSKYSGLKSLDDQGDFHSHVAGLASSFTHPTRRMLSITRWFVNLVRYPSLCYYLEKSCHPRQRWQRGWLASFSLLAPPSEEFKVVEACKSLFRPFNLS